eukprot:Pgem_evm1s9069
MWEYSTLSLVVLVLHITNIHAIATITCYDSANATFPYDLNGGSTDTNCFRMVTDDTTSSADIGKIE